MTETCPRLSNTTAATCSFCGNSPDEACPLNEPAPFAGPAIGAAVGATGECSGGEVCEACQ